MPSPIGHSLAGCAIYAGTNDNYTISWKTLFLYILVANLPDFDFIPGFLLGAPNSFHRGVSHSLGFAFLFGIVLGLLVARNTTTQRFFKNILIFSGLYFSHIFLDLFSMDTSIPIGEKLFWPVSNEYFSAPFHFFLDIKRKVSSNYEFITTLFSFHNFLAILIEIAVLIPVLALVSFRKRRRNRQPVLGGEKN